MVITHHCCNRACEKDLVRIAMTIFRAIQRHDARHNFTRQK